MLEKQAKIVFLSIGSNLGNRKKNIELVKNKLEKNKIKIIKSSKNYESFSWPDSKKPKFINVVLKIETIYTPDELFDKCINIENELGRKRNKKNDPRTCDIDIIDYDKKIFKKVKKHLLTIPHPKMHMRNFVLVPLFEINKTWKHPVKKVSVKELINRLKIKDLKAIKLI